MVEQSTMPTRNETKANDDDLVVDRVRDLSDQEKVPPSPSPPPAGATLKPDSCPEPKRMMDDNIKDDPLVHLTIKSTELDQDMDSSEGPRTINNSNSNNVDLDQDSLSRKKFCGSLKDRKIVGLKNLGNTCYVNSCLQALYLTNKFRENVMKRPDYGPIHNALSQLFQQMDMAGTPLPLPSEPKFQVIKPDMFVREFRLLKPQFVKNEQHDAQEFLTILLDCIHLEANRVPKTMAKIVQNMIATNSLEAWNIYVTHIENSYYSRLFVGQLESSLKCLTCNNTSLSWNCFWQIPLHLQADNQNDEITTTTTTLSIDDCLKEYTATEIMKDDCAPFCEKCNGKRTSSKKQTICRVPHYLIVHLKRFTHTGTKINRKVIINPKLTICDKQFAIYACVLHRGTETMGHYFTLFNNNSKEWLLFDDDTIYSNINYEQVEPILQYHSYICFYKAITPIKIS